MAYKKKSYRKRGYRRRRTGGYGFWKALGSGGKFAGNVAAMASAALDTANAVKDMINVEKKFLEASSGTALSTTPQVVHLSGIAQGSGINARDGNSVKANYLGCRMDLIINPSAATSVTRLVIVQDNQQIGDTAPAWTDVFTTSDARSFLNGNTLGRFKILYDKVHTLSNSASAAIKHIEINLPMSHHLRYNGTAAADIQKGGLYFMGVSDQVTNTVTFAFISRLRYVDN